MHFSHRAIPGAGALQSTKAIQNKTHQVQLPDQKWIAEPGRIDSSHYPCPHPGDRYRGDPSRRAQDQTNDYGKSLEEFYKAPYVGFSDQVILPQSLFTGLNTNFLAKNNWLPIEKSENKVTILIDNPTNQDKFQNIKLIFSKKALEFKVGLKTDIHDFLKVTPDGSSIDDDLDEPVETEEVSSLLDALQNEAEDAATVDTSDDDSSSNAISETDSTIVKLVNKILIDAYDMGVSDIHVEPGIGKDNMEVRYRIDGGCRVF